MTHVADTELDHVVTCHQSFPGRVKRGGGVVRAEGTVGSGCNVSSLGCVYVVNTFEYIRGSGGVGYRNTVVQCRTG